MPVSRDEITRRLSAPLALTACSAASRSATSFIGWVVSSMPSDSAPRRANVTSSSKWWGLNTTATRFTLGATSFRSSIHPLGCHFIREKRNPGEILTWPSKRHRHSRPHRTVADATNDGYAAFTCLEQRHDKIANGEQEVRFLRDKFGG